ncbi:hypothetical protein AKJ08_0166 [Vulgatibacter incomptus]|uniref:PEGA domain-containing protein n=1 Tax=Vulgatibacter incomptus TaxID=1391653 RepID=A0A0K1P9K4_9BACT|nr:hypothetical protein AKJ08_0166 [Vulgatibacter incomptus]
MLALALLLLPSIGLAAAEPETWAVVGLRGPAASRMHDRVETLRGFLALSLREGKDTRVLGEEETRARLGLETRSFQKIEAQIDGAELFYFQLELRHARDNLEQALAALAHHGGPEAWERTRVSRLLLATVLLAERGSDSRAKAREALGPIARVRPDYRPPPMAYPAELIALHDEVRQEVVRLPKGWLRVDCEAACPGGQVWVETFPLGAPGEAIPLPAGRYRVTIGDSFEKPTARSLLREVVVEAGRETSLLIDLGIEGSADAGDGPSFLVPNEEARLVAAHRAAAQLGTSQLVVLWAEPDGEAKELHAAVIEASTGRLRRQASVAFDDGSSEGAALERLAKRLIGSETTDVADAVGSGGGDARSPGAGAADDAGVGILAIRSEPSVLNAAAPKAESATAQKAAARKSAPESATAPPSSRLDGRVASAGEPPSWVPTARWTGVAVTAVAATAGLWLRANATSQIDRLRGSGPFASVSEARQASADLASAGTRADVGTSLLVGAGAAAVTTLVLHLLDFDAPTSP